MRDTQPRDEQGSALVIALVMLTVVGLMVGAALTYSRHEPAHAPTTAYRPNRASLYAADSAIQGAIEYVRDNPEMATDVLGSRCICRTSTSYTDPKVGVVSVDACPQSDSLIYEGSFRAVLLTLGTTATDGIILGHNGDVNVGGHVWSNSKIDLSATRRTWSMNGGGSGHGVACNRPGNIEMPTRASSPICNASTNPLRRRQAQGRARPGRSRRSATSPTGGPPAAPASLVQPAIPALRCRTTMTLQPGVYYSGDEFSDQDQRVRQRHAEPGRLLPRLPGRRRRVEPRQRTSTGTCDASGQGVQIVFADSRAHQALRHAHDPVRPQRDTERSADRALRPEGGHRRDWSVHDHAATDARRRRRPGTFWHARRWRTITAGAAPTYPQDGTNATASVTGNKSTSELHDRLDRARPPDRRSRPRRP